MPNWRKTRSEIGVAVHRDKHADTSELRRRLKAERLEEHVQNVLAQAPRLTAPQLAPVIAALQAYAPIDVAEQRLSA